MFKILFYFILLNMSCANLLLAQDVFFSENIGFTKILNANADLNLEGGKKISFKKKASKRYGDSHSLESKLDLMEEKINELYKILERQDYLLSHYDEVSDIKKDQMKNAYNDRKNEFVNIQEYKDDKIETEDANDSVKIENKKWEKQSLFSYRGNKKSALKENLSADNNKTDDLEKLQNDSEEVVFSMLDERAEERESYDNAFNAMRANDLDRARDLFFEFVANYPKSDLIANTHYWIGEIYYKNENFKDASDHYLLSYQAQENGIKSADSIFKLALCLEYLGNISGACATLSQLFESPSELPMDLKRAANIEVSKLRCSFNSK